MSSAPSRIRSIETIDGPPGSDPSVARVIAKLDPPASRDELRVFGERLDLGRVVGGAQDGAGFDVQMDVLRTNLGEALEAFRKLVEDTPPA